MKKSISLLLTIAIITVCIFGIVTANAEEFQLRNGIVFGDTLDIIKQKETLPLRSGQEEETTTVWFDGTIAGMDGSVRYDFNEETGTLTDMLYSFDTSSSKDSVDNDYSKLRSSLIRKYGNPLGNTGGTLHIITGTAIESVVTTIALYMYLLDGDGDLRDYDEWIVECDGYNVKIDLVSYYTRNKSFDYTYGNKISYHYYTNDDLLNAINEKQAENDAIDNDL